MKKIDNMPFFGNDLTVQEIAQYKKKDRTPEPFFFNDLTAKEAKKAFRSTKDVPILTNNI